MPKDTLHEKKRPERPASLRPCMTPGHECSDSILERARRLRTRQRSAGKLHPSGRIGERACSRRARPSRDAERRRIPAITSVQDSCTREMDALVQDRQHELAHTIHASLLRCPPSPRAASSPVCVIPPRLVQPEIRLRHDGQDAAHLHSSGWVGELAVVLRLEPRLESVKLLL